MYHKNKRLTEADAENIIRLSKAEGFPFMLPNGQRGIKLLQPYFGGATDTEPRAQIYGQYIGRKLIAVATATFQRVFFHPDNPNGRTVYVSGMYVLPQYRHKGVATSLLESIEKDAKKFKADCLYCDNSDDGLYISNGFIKQSSKESRLWKPLG